MLEDIRILKQRISVSTSFFKIDCPATFLLEQEETVYSINVLLTNVRGIVNMGVKQNRVN